MKSKCNLKVCDRVKKKKQKDICNQRTFTEIESNIKHIRIIAYGGGEELE